MNREQITALLHRADIVLAQAAEARDVWDRLYQTPVTVAEHPCLGAAHVLPPGVVHWHDVYLHAEMAHRTGVEDALQSFAEYSQRVAALRPKAAQATAGFFKRMFGMANVAEGHSAAAELAALLDAPAGQRAQPILDAARQALSYSNVQTTGYPELYTAFAARSLAQALGLRAATEESLDTVTVAGLRALAREVMQHPDSEPRLRAEAEIALRELTEQRVTELLAGMPVDMLKQATKGQLRFAGLDTIHVTTVADVLSVPMSTLTAVRGIGEQTARRMKAAAQTLLNEAKSENSTRIGDVPSAPAMSLVRVLYCFGQLVELDPAERARKRRIIEYAQALPDVTPGPDLWRVMVPQGDTTFQTFLDDAAWALASPGLFQPRNVVDIGDGAWEDYLQRPAHYQGLLTTLLGLDIEVSDDLLDTSIIEQIRAMRLDTSLLRELHLRGYQSFGARFALVQKKTILGDEMGLGKTMQAIAMLAHLHAKGTSHSVVVCPASLVVNWVRELRAFSTLPVYVAHGVAKQDALGAWSSAGGVLICTYDGARTLEFAQLPQVIVADEAHYLKNPRTRRSVAVSELISAATHALLLTGTPLENRVSEFLTLVGYLQPDLVPSNTGSALGVRRAIAPAYLRRNQADVLDELPERLEHIDWVELNEDDREHYLAAVRSGNWMEIRRAPMLTPNAEPAKLERIRTIVEHATENGDRVLLFSYFLPVLERLADTFGDRVVGTITGQVAPAARQELVDALATAAPGSLLLAQITAAGVGLNIQAAAVVILVEPQVKPTLEDQAVARAHRMGQTRVVQVHRLVADDTADERMLEMLASKRSIFDAYARPSESAKVDDAVDITEGELAAKIIAAERKRWHMDA